MSSVLYDRVKELCSLNMITPERLGEIVGISVSSIRTWKTSTPSVDKVKSVAEYFHVSIDYLMGITDIPLISEELAYDQSLIDAIREDGEKVVPIRAFSPEALRVAKRWSYLDESGKYTVEAVISAEERRIQSITSEKKPARIIPLIGNSFAAGVGEPDFGNALEDYEISADQKADFAVRVNGKSMEPYLKDGQIALGIKGTPKIGDIVAIMVDGAFYVKQFVIDNYGNMYLLSLNKDYPNVEVKANAESTVCCFGIIQTGKRIPLAY